MPTVTTTATYFLAPEYAPRLQQLAREGPPERDPRFAPLAQEGGMAAFIERSVKERAEGLAYGFAIVDRQEPVGFCVVDGLTHPVAPTVECWVAPPFRRRGFGNFGVGKLLELSFQNLQLPRLRAHADGAAWRALLERAGFAPAGTGDSDALELTRERWLEHRDAPALGRLHPALQTLLRAELEAGNEVLETGGGWPDADSVFVRVKHPFRARPASLPDGVEYLELNDPHWWKAEYGTRSPRHILAC
jgi:RimJ/RimL family protein N-acetyltransferase